MHPVLIVVPVLGAVLGPRLWARAQLNFHDGEDSTFLPAGELARRLLDRHGLGQVRVEVTDLGDHYDPLARAVRLNRARFERRSLTAATTAAHEVGHALQDASGHWAFRLHRVLVRVARVTTGVGSALLLAVPVAAVAAQTPAPARGLGVAAVAMLGTGFAAQLAALPSELDASFARALPLLRDCCLSEAQAQDARRILFACSLTYVASAAVPALALFPWLAPWPGARVGAAAALGLMASGSGFAPVVPAARERAVRRVSGGPDLRRSSGLAPRDPPLPGVFAPIWVAAPRAAAGQRREAETLLHCRRAAVARGVPELAPPMRALRRLARPLLRGWLRVTGDY
ncbi:zinc metallopeptidase [Thiohalocapsa sp. ML1]|jgi:uncharacterized protein|uniref:zinc metallopeptidase n=1 Tax=Thiohalocapsa sp. ML1 TaxID=1431688 RepID=UPI00138F5057|nr:zinc metallopeptidase [Thiohalocapsa sp. ML1]